MRFFALAATAVLLAGCTQQVEQPAIPESIDLAENTQQAQPEMRPETSSGVEQPSGQTAETPSSIDSGSKADQVIDDSEIEIEDQSGDGKSIRISEIETNLASGLLVIFGLEGQILGSAVVSSSVQPVTLDLDTNLTQSSELIARLYSDNGNGVFDESDLPVFEQEDYGLERVEEEFEYELQ